MIRALLAALLVLAASTAEAASYTYTALTEARCARSDSTSERYTICSTNADCGAGGLCVAGYIRNPYRGFHGKGECPDSNWNPDSGSSQVGTADQQFAQGRSLVYDRVHLGAYEGTDTLPSSLLTNLGNRLVELRPTGTKAVIRFRYNTGANVSKARIKAHMTQALGVLKNYPDTLAWLEAGFFGNYGEWHSWSSIDTSLSTAGDANVTELSDHIYTLLNSDNQYGSEVPVLFRYPRHMRMFMDRTPSTSFSADADSYATSAESYNDSNRARTGLHNDCVSYSADTRDRGTYGTDCANQANCDDKVFARNQLDWVFTGGEACSWDTYATASASHPIQCDLSLPQLVLNNWANIEDCWGEGQKTLDFWQSDGCMDEIAKYLGYYYVLTAATLPNSVSASGTGSFSFTMRNDGMSRLYHKRTAYITLNNGTTRVNIALAADIRKLFAPGGAATGTPVTVTETLTIPGALPSGTYTVALYIPDFSPRIRHTSNGGQLSTLADEVKSNIRVANAGTWNTTYGYNELGTLVVGTGDQCDSAADCPDDTNVCTTKVCNNPTLETSTCGNVANSVDCTALDGLFCNGTDTCAGTTCSVHTGNPCLITQTCNENSNTCDATNPCTTDSQCNDNNACTTDSCEGETTGFPTLAGRIAVSADGNKHDCDDIGASAVMVGLMGVTGNAAKLVYYGHSDHHWDSEGTCGTYSGDARETAMSESTLSIANTWNPTITPDFATSVFRMCSTDVTSGNNCGTNCLACRDALVTAINASSSGDRLYIMAVGPQDIVGRALAAANASARQYVTVIGHGSATGFNAAHSDNPFVGESPAHAGWTRAEMIASFSTTSFPLLPNQNNELNVSLSNWAVWNDTGNPRMKAIYDRIANNGADNNGGDISDSGVAWWVVNGFPTNQTPSPTELKATFTTSPAQPGVCQNLNNTNTCTDGLFCNGLDSCSAGACSVHAGDPCPLGQMCGELTNTCDVDACNGDADCAETPTDNPCTTNTCLNPTTSTSTCQNQNNTTTCTAFDGLFCNGTDSCSGGTCSVHSGNPCTAANSSCNESTNTCDIDLCDSSAECAESPTDNVCTTDVCLNASSPTSTCQRTNNAVACDDGTFCNGLDTCDLGTCQVHAGPPCPAEHTCLEASETCVPVATDACDSNNDCNETPTDNGCTINTCNDAASETSTCSSAVRSDGSDCFGTSSRLHDGIFCNGADRCLAGACDTHIGSGCSGVTECIEDWRVPVCHYKGQPWLDYPKVVSQCFNTPSQTTTLQVDIRDERVADTETQAAMGRRKLVVWYAARGAAGSSVCKPGAGGIVPQPSMTFAGSAMARQFHDGIATINPPGGFCYGAYTTTTEPPPGAANLVISWPGIVDTVAVFAVPLYNSGWDTMGTPTEFSSLNMAFPHTENVTLNNYPLPGALNVGFLATALPGTLIDQEDDPDDPDITEPTHLTAVSCGSPGLAAELQFNEHTQAGTTYPVEFRWGFSLGSAPAAGFFSEHYDTVATTSTTTTTTLLAGDPPGRTKCKAKCKAKLK